MSRTVYVALYANKWYLEWNMNNSKLITDVIMKQLQNCAAICTIVIWPQSEEYLNTRTSHLPFLYKLVNLICLYLPLYFPLINSS